MFLIQRNTKKDEDLEMQGGVKQSSPDNDGDGKCTRSNMFSIAKKIAITVVVVFVLFKTVFFLFNEGYFDVPVKGKMMVIYCMTDTLFTMKQGMFSDMHSVIGALKYAEMNGAAGVRVQYENPIYVDKAHGDNWWGYFFEPEMIVDPTIKNPVEVHFNGWLSRFGRLGTFSRFVTGHRPNKARPYPVSHELTMNEVGELVKKYFRIKPDILKKARDYWDSKVKEGDFVVGIHYRGTDKKLIYPYLSPSYDTFSYYIAQVAKKYAVEESKLKIFVATDESEFLDWMTMQYGESKVLYWADSPRLSKDDVEATAGGTHKSSKFGNYLKAETGMLDCLLLAFSNYLIKNRSSLSDVSLAFHRAFTGKLMDYTFIIGPKDPVISTDDLPPPPHDVWTSAMDYDRGATPPQEKPAVNVDLEAEAAIIAAEDELGR